MNKQPYTYTILRYVHDTTTGEFANVGVVLLCPELRYADALLSPKYSRLSKMFHGLDGDHYRTVIRHLQVRFSDLAGRFREELKLQGMPQRADELAFTAIAADDSSFQWSPLGSGLTHDPAATLESLFERMVERYEDKKEVVSRTDDEIWKSFKKEFEERKILSRFAPKTISVKDDEIEFSHSWKNKQWHCLESVSFDLQQAQSITDKASLWLGRVMRVQNASERFKVYYLVGQPQLERSKAAFDRALNILHKTPVAHEIIREDEADDFAEAIAGKIKEHDKEGLA
ncbi:MAG: DUF3037 domain-containing protein [Puniceicoccaceae bacterium]